MHDQYRISASSAADDHGCGWHAADCPGRGAVPAQVPGLGRTMLMTDVHGQGEDRAQGRYADAFRQSLADPEGFWGAAAKAIDWYREPTAVLDASNSPFSRWFAGGVLNTCYNALDRHVRGGRADQAALIYDSPVTGTCRTFSYQQLLEEVARFGGVLAGLGAAKGDRVVIYMPMIPEAVIAMLACA